MASNHRIQFVEKAARALCDRWRAAFAYRNFIQGKINLCTDTAAPHDKDFE
eukprot:CAMPEP_0176467592 /NCGR_PEP_ID=MMETSP0127-20121128/38548_1 /TAXON_ID=938130 /ORGANISM="Platyophrya macrostoma, Strain WH" /LENGTH=50 /DNA_ID=CAMNT_0017860917 /DNA_START=237 /DNA_END=389 /DNA_ORIENTATION=+